MSILLNYTGDTTATDDLSGTVNFTSPITLDKSHSAWRLRLVNYSMSRLICNIHTAYANNRLRVSVDGALTYTTMTLPNGQYSISSINLAIQRMFVDNGWSLDLLDVGIVLGANTSVSRCYLSVDTTKMAGATGNVIVDFNSSLADFLGFQSTPALTTVLGTSVVHDAADVARVDWYGNSLSLRLMGFGLLGYSNANQSFEILNIPLAVISGESNTYDGPLLMQPAISIDPPESISVYRVEVRGTNDIVLHWLPTSVLKVSFELIRVASGFRAG